MVAIERHDRGNVWLTGRPFWGEAVFLVKLGMVEFVDTFRDCRGECGLARAWDACNGYEEAIRRRGGL